MKNIKILIISILLTNFTLFAQVTGYLNQIDEIMTQNLNKSDKSSLTALRESAMELAVLVKECNSISINSTPNPKCETFYKTELPKFEQDFSKVTNGIYINNLKLTNSLKTKKDQINSCVESIKYFYSASFYPENMITTKNKRFDINPTSNNKNVIVDFNIIISFDANRAVTFHKSMKKWYKVCLPIVSNGTEFNDYFIERVKSVISGDEYVALTTKSKLVVVANNRDYQMIVNGITLFKTDLYKMIRGYNNLSKIETSWITLNANKMEVTDNMEIKETFINVGNQSEFSGKRTIPVNNGIEGNFK